VEGGAAPAARADFDGALFAPVLERIAEIHREVLRGRVFVALHMHAGDGNVHTNIPVNSDNYEMLQTANRAVDRIMALARSLDGVISGEHGIGITKLDYLTDDEMANFWAYKEKVDPEGRFNRGKLMRKGAEPRQRLHPQLQPDGPRVHDHGADRCRRDRPRHQGLPALRQVQAGVLHPRAARQPAVQPAQQDPQHLAADRGLPVRGADPPRRVAGALGRVRGRGRPLHVCHKCEKPCPVDIDFGDVSIKMRNLLRKQGKKSFNPGKAAAMAFLTHQGPGHHQGHPHRHDRLGLQGAALRPRAGQEASA
jgi:hypothetical protein